MIEYKMTQQAMSSERAPVEGQPARETDLQPPAGESWTLHSFVPSPTQVIAVWAREKRPMVMSEAYSHEKV